MTEIKKEDKKTVFEKKEVSFAEVKKIITEKLNKGINILKVRKELLDQNVSNELINDALLEFAKETQDKTVENMKKKGTFSPEMSSEQIKEIKKKRKIHHQQMIMMMTTIIIIIMMTPFKMNWSLLNLRMVLN
jgi:DNA-directed RNA polymerase specialized sigma54-like protein